MVEGEEEDERKIFLEKPHSTWGNDFIGYQIMNWLGGD